MNMLERAVRDRLMLTATTSLRVDRLCGPNSPGSRPHFGGFLHLLLNAVADVQQDRCGIAERGWHPCREPHEKKR
jgi:hypothetical protein